MKTTRPAPVSAAFIHEENDAYIFISSAMLENEIAVFLQALKLDKSDIIEPDNDDQFRSLALQLELLLVSYVLPPKAADLKKQLMPLDEKDRGILLFRLYQLKNVLRTQTQTRFGDTYLVSPSWKRRWFELIAGKVLHADVICLDVDSFQP